MLRTGSGLILAAIIVGTVGGASAALTTRSLNDGLTPDTLGGAILGSGVAISNVTVRGCAAGLGTFAGGGDIVGLETGLVLSSGRVAHAIGPNEYPNVSTPCDAPGDGDLDALVPGVKTADAAVLELDVVPAGDMVTFRYVFASDEYAEFVGSQYNDVFGFFVNGVNLALLPGTALPVAVNSVNASQNGLLFIDNDFATAANQRDTEADGLTQVLTFTAPVVAGQPNHIKLAIADTADPILDSWIFVGAESLSSTTADVGVRLKGRTAVLDVDLGTTGAKRGVAEAAGFALLESTPGSAAKTDAMPGPPGLTVVMERVRKKVGRNGRARVRLKLTRGGRKVLKAHGGLQVLVVARVTDREGRSVDFQRLVELRGRRS